MYNDDFVVDDKRGPHTRVNSLSAFYYMFPTAPPQLVSKIDFIFDAMTVKAEDIKNYGNDSPIYALLNILRKMEVEGITIFKGTDKERTIHVVLSKFFGDNLGMHAFCGFRDPFTILRPCIICEIISDELKQNYEIDTNLIRTIEKYNAYFLDGNFIDFGVKGKCLLNGLRSFHVILNKTVDLMHDMQLSVLKFILQCALNYFIRTYHDFDLITFNSQFETFQLWK